jgi:thiol-disulfide isomerase/thioredoxin
VLLTPSADGRRSGTLRARRDTVAYRVVDITARTYLPPAGATTYRWAPDGEYDGLLMARAGDDVRLVYDSSLVAVGGASSFKVVGAHALAPIIAQLDSIFTLPSRKRCILAAQATPIDPADAVLPDTSLAERLKLVRRFLRADAECQVHPALGALVVAQFSPGSPLWQLDDVMRRRVLLLAARQAAGQTRFNTPAAVAMVKARFDASLAAAADTTERFDLYVSAAETFMPADTVSAQLYAARFVAESYDHPRLLPLLKLTGYNRVLQPGMRVPAFSVPSMDDPKVMISDVSLRGKAYLLDVWATWCPDCIVELPALRALHERFARSGLTLLSVSIDEEQGTADRFRRVREPMPWTHGWAGVWPDGEGPMAGFEVTWLPTTILVGKDGRILALAPKLDSPEFAALVAQALK